MDIEKAYYRVNTDMVCRVLEEVGVSARVVNVIMSMYVNTRAKNRLRDFESGWITSRRGVRQGCTLSPLLSGLYTEELAERLRNTGMGINVDEMVEYIIICG